MSFVEPKSANEAITRLRALTEESKEFALKIQAAEESGSEAVGYNSARYVCDEEIAYLRDWLRQRPVLTAQAKRRSIGTVGGTEQAQQVVFRQVHGHRVSFVVPGSTEEAASRRESILEELEKLEGEIVILNHSNNRHRSTRRAEAGLQKLVLCANISYLNEKHKELAAEERRAQKVQSLQRKSDYNTLLSKVYCILAAHTSLHNLSDEELEVLDTVEQYLEEKGFNFEEPPDLAISDPASKSDAVTTQ